MIIDKLPAGKLVVPRKEDFFTDKGEFKPHIMIYMESFINPGNYECYRTRNDPEAIDRLQPWIEAGKCWIHIEDQRKGLIPEPEKFKHDENALF